jgi:hypothetical protein
LKTPLTGRKGLYQTGNVSDFTNVAKTTVTHFTTDWLKALKTHDSVQQFSKSIVGKIVD